MSLDNESIVNMLDSYDKDSKAMRKFIYKLAWYMRGSLSTDDAFLLSHDDREIINKIIEENIKVTNETKLPFF